jgi:hypothetical protein
MKTKTNKHKSEEKNYSAIYLAIILCLVLLIEGFLIGVASSNAWIQGFEVLDISGGVDMVFADMWDISKPFFQQYEDIKTFYQLAADEVILMFDLSDSDPLVFFKGVFEFYEVSSIEMEQMLDFSDTLVSFGNVASASISR